MRASMDASLASAITEKWLLLQGREETGPRRNAEEQAQAKASTQNHNYSLGKP